MSFNQTPNRPVEKLTIPEKPQEDKKLPKKQLFASYVHGITDEKHGESYNRILRYFLPEWVTMLFLYSVLYLLDARWIADLKSTSMYATIGITNTLLHFLIKMGEGFSVGSIIVAGQYNGKKKFHEVGRTLVDSFWVTTLGGAGVAIMLYFSAYWIYYFYGVPEKMIQLGTPFLKIRAVSFFFMFMYFSLIAYLRGIKNTKIPMIIFMIGGLLFLVCDYGLIFGAFGFPKMGLCGSALASTIQYTFMALLALGYVMFHPANKKYGIALLSGVSSWEHIKRLIHLSWPVMLDKTSIALAYIWLGYLLAPMGKYVLASYAVIKDLERFAIQPAAGFAQVVTFLVSNASGVYDWEGIKSNIKKCVFLASLFVFSFLLVFSLWPNVFMHLFDQKGKFTGFAARAFPYLSILVFFDLLQLILAGALRGAANVKLVMLVRVLVCLLFFVPVSWYISRMTFENDILKFLLIYGSFYCGSGLMSMVYIWRFRGERWKSKVT